MGSTVTIRKLADLADLEAMRELETAVWQDSAVPVHHTLTVGKNGGIILGAFCGAQLVGFVYSFPGYLAGMAYLCSHTMGVREGWRHSGIGERLKRAQAEAALLYGYRMITWTYDPLETANGWLNIAKLGAVCSTYLVNCYGEMSDAINQGIASDRFQVAWWINQPKPAVPVSGSVRVINWQGGRDGFVKPVSLNPIPIDGPGLRIAVPAVFQDIKRRDVELAKEWRAATRQAFRASFERGWAVGGLQKGDNGIHEYLLCRRSILNLPVEPWNGR